MQSIDSNVSVVFQNTNDNKESQIYNLLKNMLDAHAYPPGSIITERKLSEIYNMSRTPIRAALRQLTFEGLLQFVPGKGIIVPEYTIEDILEVYELIETLHIYAVKRCIHNLSHIPIETLKSTIDTMEKALQANDMETFVQSDKDFHALLIAQASNQRLSGIYTPLDNQSALFKAKVSEDISQAKRSHTEHIMIYDAILSKDTPAAENAVKNHYQSIRQYHIDKLIGRFTL